MTINEGVGMFLPVPRPLKRRPFSSGISYPFPPPGIHLHMRRRGSVESNPALQKVLIDENPAALPAHKKTLFKQLIIGQNDGVSGDSQLFCQFARRWQPSSGRKGAGNDCVYKLLPNLALKTELAARVKVYECFRHASVYPRFMMRPFCRSQSRSFSVLRLSCWRLPLAMPISTFTLPWLQYIAVGTTV